MENAVTKRVHIFDTLQRTFRHSGNCQQDLGRGEEAAVPVLCAERNEAGNVENGFRAAHRTAISVGAARLRQVPPVIADRVTDPKRSVLRGTDEEKW